MQTLMTTAHDDTPGHVLVNRGYGVQPFVVWYRDANGNHHHGCYFRDLAAAVACFKEKTRGY